MSDEANWKTLSVTDPETGETDEITFPTEIGDWEYYDDGDKPVVWKPNGKDERVRVEWSKPGGHTYSAMLRYPGLRRGDDGWSERTGDPDSALDAAIEYLRNNSPDEVIERYCPDAYAPPTEDDYDTWEVQVSRSLKGTIQVEAAGGKRSAKRAAEEKLTDMTLEEMIDAGLELSDSARTVAPKKVDDST